MKLHVTPAAKEALNRFRNTSGMTDPVVAILWGANVDGGNQGWDVGLYERDDLARKGMPPEWLLTCSGIEFVVDDRWHSKLSGKTLDYVSGRFVIRDGDSDASPAKA